MGVNDSEYCHIATGAVGDVGTMRNKIIGIYRVSNTQLGIAYDNGTNIVLQSITLSSTNTSITVYDPLG